MNGVLVGGSMLISGEVSSGLGRAHIFMAQPHYKDQFESLLDMNAWPGTLNVKVSGESLDNYKRLRVCAGLEEGVDSGINSYRINGFERDGKSFGGATAFHAEMRVGVQNQRCAILIPDLTRHEDVVEIIANVFLREKLELTDGKVVNIYLESDQIDE